MCRGNNGQSIFMTNSPLLPERSGATGKGQRLFLSTLEEVCQQTGWRIYAYALMGNHYHLLLETPEANLVAGMKWFQGTYTQRFNAMFRCRGHLFQGRYKALPIEADRDPAYFREAGQYIHLNPFRAGLAGIGMTQPLEAYPWSSYAAYVGHRRKIPSWLECGRLLHACGFDPQRPKSRAYYRELVERRMSGEALAGPVEELVEKQLERGWFVGGEAFKRWLAERLPKQSDNLRGEQRRAHNELEAERLLTKALHVMNLTEDELLSMRSNQSEKQAVAWLLKQHTTATGVWISARLGMGDRSNVSRALSAVTHAADPERKRWKKRMTQCTG